MKLTKIGQGIANISKSKEEKQKNLTVGEVWYLTGHLQMRNSVLQATNIMKNFAKDPDLRLLLDTGVKILRHQVETMEKLMEEYSLPMPPRPPLDVKCTANLELLSDRYIFRTIFRGIQSFITVHAEAFTGSTDPTIREHFKTFLIEEIELYDGLMEYGKVKGYEVVPPRYKY